MGRFFLCPWAGSSCAHGQVLLVFSGGIPSLAVRILFRPGGEVLSQGAGVDLVYGMLFLAGTGTPAPGSGLSARSVGVLSMALVGVGRIFFWRPHGSAHERLVDVPR